MCGEKERVVTRMPLLALKPDTGSKQLPATLGIEFIRAGGVLQCTATYCNIRQCTAMYSNVRQCTAMYSNVRQHTAMYCDVWQCTAMYGNDLQYTTTYCNVRQCTAMYSNVLRCTVMYCNIWQCIAMYGNVRQTPERKLRLQSAQQPYFTGEEKVTWIPCPFQTHKSLL